MLKGGRRLALGECLKCGITSPRLITVWVVKTAVVPVAAQSLRYEGLGLFQEMNVYRSFGNLMEAWVNEGNLYADPPTPSSESGADFRSYSVDSGVETASSDTSFPVSSSFFLTENAEIETFTPEIQSHGFTPASTPQSPAPSSPVPSFSSPPSLSPQLSLSQPLDGHHAMHLKMEETGQTSDSEPQKDSPRPLTVVEEVLRRRPRSSFLPKRHASELLKGPRRTAHPALFLKQISETVTRPRSVSCDQQTLEERGREARVLSPGLLYLEQVCQILEDIAKQQMQNRETQAEFDTLCEHQELQAAGSCHPEAGDELTFRQGVRNDENRGHRATDPQQRKKYQHGHFRQRSASDTTIATLHLREMNLNSRGQHLRKDDLVEIPDEDQTTEECKTVESKRPDKNWRTRIASLRREVSNQKETRSQQMQPSEKNSARRRFSQLFRMRRKTLPQ